jgi:hypothetical protein
LAIPLFPSENRGFLLYERDCQKIEKRKIGDCTIAALKTTSGNTY